MWQVTVNDSAGHVATGSVSVTFTYPLPPLTVTTTPASLVAVGSGSGMVSGQVSAAVSGGVAPYTYAWSRVTGSMSQLLSGGDASAVIGASLPGAGSVSESWRVDVTDSRGAVGHATVPTTFNIYGLSLVCTQYSLSGEGGGDRHIDCGVYNYTASTQSTIVIQSSDNNTVRYSPLYLYNCAVKAFCGRFSATLDGHGHLTGWFKVIGSADGSTATYSYDTVVP